MKSLLNNKEWLFLSQMIFRFTQCNSYEDFARITMTQLKTLIPYQKAVMTRAVRSRGRVIQTDCFSIDRSGKETRDCCLVDNNCRLPWFEYMYYSWSKCFRYSDITDEKTWESSYEYLNLWKPQGVFYGLSCTLVHYDNALGVFTLYRCKEDPDFNEKELFILEMIKLHLELKLFSLFEHNHDAESKDDTAGKNLTEFTNKYHITPREADVAALLVEGKSNQEMCEELGICFSTVNKHIHNIYQKTKVTSRSQLMLLILNK